MNFLFDGAGYGPCSGQVLNLNYSKQDARYRWRNNRARSGCPPIPGEISQSPGCACGSGAEKGAFQLVACQRFQRAFVEGAAHAQHPGVAFGRADREGEVPGARFRVAVFLHIMGGPPNQPDRNLKSLSRAPVSPPSSSWGVCGAGVMGGFRGGIVVTGRHPPSRSRSRTDDIAGRFTRSERTGGGGERGGRAPIANRCRAGRCCLPPCRLPRRSRAWQQARANLIRPA